MAADQGHSQDIRYRLLVLSMKIRITQAVIIQGLLMHTGFFKFLILKVFYTNAHYENTPIQI